jgi:hypothetical protein
VYDHVDTARVFVCNECNNAINNVGAIQLVYNEDLEIGRMIVDDEKIHSRFFDRIHSERILMKRVSKLLKAVTERAVKRTNYILI